MNTKEAARCFGTVIRKRRHGMRLSQEELAGCCCLHRTYIGSVERGERNISLENIVKLAVALDTTAAALLKEAEL